MLDHLGRAETATTIRGALDTVVHEGKARTADMGGSASTKDFTAALLKALG